MKVGCYYILSGSSSMLFYIYIIIVMEYSGVF